MTLKWLVLVGFALVATVIAQLMLYQKSAKDVLHEFANEQSPDFVAFFKEWYSRNGKHDIYCKDLDWLDRPELKPVVEVLCGRSKQVSIFIREQDARVCQQLREAGVNMYLVPEVARSEMKMSLRSDDDDKELIVRRKRPGSQMVRFIHSQDQHMLGLAEDLFTLYRARRPTASE